MVGFIFRSSRRTYTYRPRHIELQMAITERLSQAVEKAWRIEQLEEAQPRLHADARLRQPRAQEPGGLDGHRRAAARRRATSASSPRSSRRKLAGITRKGQYLLGLVNEYLDLARVEGGELQLDRARAWTSTWRSSRRRSSWCGRSSTRTACSCSRRLPMAGSALVCCDPTLLRIVARQPARQRRQVRQRGRRGQADRRGHAGARAAARPSSRSACATRGRASARRRRTSSSGASRASTTRRSRTAAAPASGCTTRGASSSCTRSHHRRVQARRVGEVLFRDTGDAGVRVTGERRTREYQHERPESWRRERSSTRPPSAKPLGRPPPRTPGACARSSPRRASSRAWTWRRWPCSAR